MKSVPGRFYSGGLDAEKTPKPFWIRWWLWIYCTPQAMNDMTAGDYDLTLFTCFFDDKKPCH